MIFSVKIFIMCHNLNPTIVTIVMLPIKIQAYQTRSNLKSYDIARI